MSNVTHIGPLHGVTVVDLTMSESGRFCGTLLADMGAVVTRIDSKHGGSDDSDTFICSTLLRNRHVITATDAGHSFRDCLAQSQVLLVDDGTTIPDGLSRADCLALQPSMIYCAIAPFGSDGPWAGRFGSDLVIQALSGFMELTGEPGRPPIRMGARVLPLMAGAAAAIEIVSCLLNDHRHGGVSIDVSVLDVALNTLTYMAPMYLSLGQVPGRVGSGHTTIYPYNAFEVADGYIVAAPFTGRFWRNFCQALGSPEWAADVRFKDFQNRLDNRAILEPMLNARMREKTRQEWLDILETADVPCGPVNTVAEAIEMDVSQARALVTDIKQPSGPALRALGFPLKITNSDGCVYQASYQQQHPVNDIDKRSPAQTNKTPAIASDAPIKPLAGIRVLDLTRMAAGPYCTQMLADLGADVIKVEEPKIGDPTRRNVPLIGKISSYFYAFNRGKKSIVLDMKSKADHQVVRQLMNDVDVVVENFRPGVMERLGLDFPKLSKYNKRLVFTSISGFGQTGPMREKISFDLVNQAIAGMLSITSEPGRPPARLGMAVGDLGGGLFACLGIVAALKQRERTGVGAHIDVSLHDVLVTLLGGIAQDYLSTGKTPVPMGSEHAHHVPERVFATSDGWVALEAWTDLGWQQLIEEPGFESLRDVRFGHLADRLVHRQAIHQALESIIATRSSSHWMKLAQKPGVGIAPIANVAQALDSEHVVARNLVVTNTLPDGMHGRTMGSAFRINGQQLVTSAGPPALGAHNDDVIGGRMDTPSNHDEAKMK